MAPHLACGRLADCSGQDCKHILCLGNRGASSANSWLKSAAAKKECFEAFLLLPPDYPKNKAARQRGLL